MGVRIRESVPADADAITRVHIDTWRSSYAGIVPDEHLAGLSYSDREAVWVQILSRDDPAQCNFVAETGGGEIVGFAGGGPEREGNEVYRVRAVRRLPARVAPAAGSRAAARLCGGPGADGGGVRLDAAVGAGGQPPRPPVLRVAGGRVGRPEAHRDWRRDPGRGILWVDGHNRPGCRAREHDITGRRADTRAERPVAAAAGEGKIA